MSYGVVQVVRRKGRQRRRSPSVLLLLLRTVFRTTPYGVNLSEWRLVQKLLNVVEH